MKQIGLGLIFILGVFGHAYGASLPSPFDAEPYNADGLGPSAANLFGSFRRDGSPPQFRFFIGTEFNWPGALIMDWAKPFRDGPGDDFAILTTPQDQGWGPLGDRALFQVFSQGELQIDFVASLGPGQLFRFEFPDNTVVGDRIVVTNITPDPPGINSLAAMGFDNAGVSTVGAVPVPPAISLFSSSLVVLGLLSYFWRRRREEDIPGGTLCA